MGTSLMNPAPIPWPVRACQVLRLAAVAATIGIPLGLLDFRTRWEVPGGHGYDHFVHWAAETAGLGCVALLLLLNILDALRNDGGANCAWLRRAAVMSLLAAGCCAGAALIARWYWGCLLSEPTDPDVQVFISGGL